MGRTMALDVGNRRIGVAVTDPLGLFARPLTTVVRRGQATDLAAVAALTRAWAIDRLVVGLPLLPSGDRGEQAVLVMAFVDALAPTVDVPVDLWDESYTTVTATERLRSYGADVRRQPAAIDAAAAAVILEEWLNAQGGVTLPPPEAP